MLLTAVAVSAGAVYAVERKVNAVVNVLPVQLF
jgi:hypothetical protein